MQTVSDPIARWIAPTLTVVLAAALLAHGPVPQLANYHDFADKRAMWGVPNAADVFSNAGFAIAGAWALWIVLTRRAHASLASSWPAYAMLSAALFLTALGSGYYHLAPDNDRLLWDRLPIAADAGALIAAVHADTHERSAPWAMPVTLVAAGIASVLYWYATEQRGIGDLRPYLFLQAAAIILVPAWLFVEGAPRGDRAAFSLAIGLYLLAKLAELGDRPTFEALGFMSGHTLKHHLSVAASLVIAGRLAWRTRP